MSRNSIGNDGTRQWIVEKIMRLKKSKQIDVPVFIKVPLLCAVLSWPAYAGDVAQYLEQARKAEGAGEHREAVIHLKNALQKNPEHAEARFMLGEIYMKMGNPQAAEKELRKARKLGIDNNKVAVPLARSYLMMGEAKRVVDEISLEAGAPIEVRASLLGAQGNAYIALKEFEKAQQAFDEALQLDPRNVEAEIGKARLSMLRADFAAVAEHLDKALTVAPDNVTAWALKGELYRYQRKLDESEKAFSKALQFQPGHQPAILGMAQTLIAKGEYPRAEQEIQKILKVLPKHPLGNYLQAIVSYQSGDFRAAQNALQIVQQITPDHLPSLLLKGVVHYALDEIVQAEDALDRFLLQRPDHLPALKLMASIYMKRGDVDKVIDLLTPVVSREKADPQLLAILGSSYMRKGDMDTGNEYLEQAAAAAPGAARIQTQLAVGLLAAGKSDEAISTLETAVELDQDLIEADVLLVLGKIREGDYDGAIEAAKALSQKRADSPLPYNLIAGAYIKKTDFGQARKYLKKALEIDPKFNSAELNLAQLEAHSGNSAKAATHYRNILQRDDAHLGATIGLAELEERQGRTAQAQQLLEKARVKKPDELGLSVALVRLYLRTDNAKQALSLARQLNSKHPQNPGLIELLGNVQIVSDDARGALATFTELKKQQPQSPRAHLLLAMAQQKASDLKGAEQSLQQAIELDAGFLPAQVALAQLYVGMQRYDEANKLAKKIQSSQPDSAAGFEIEGDVALAGGKHANAVTAYEAAFSKAPTVVLVMKKYRAMRGQGISGDKLRAPLLAWLNDNPQTVAVRDVLASSYMASGMKKEAIEQYQAILQAHPEWVPALNNLAWLYHGKGEGRALEFAEKAYQIAPELPEVADTYGWILLHQGEVSRSVELLKKATEKAPGNPEIQYHMAVALEKSGKASEARAYLERALASGKDFPDKSDAKKRLQQLGN